MSCAEPRRKVETMLHRSEFVGYCGKQGLPDYLTESLTRYVYDKIACGPFLTAVLENHPVLEVIRYGSPESVEHLKALYVVLHNEVPMGWYGSALAVAEHLSPGSGRTRGVA